MNTASDTLPLRDIHLPDPVSWWPPAPGWWLLPALLLTVAFIALYLRRRYRRRAIQRSARQMLKTITQDWKQSGDASRLAKNLSGLLRRLCLSHYPRADVAGLTGQAWLQRLDSELGQEDFQRGIGRALIEAPYSTHVEFDGDALLQLCERWIRQVAGARGAGR